MSDTLHASTSTPARMVNVPSCMIHCGLCMPCIVCWAVASWLAPHCWALGLRPVLTGTLCVLMPMQESKRLKKMAEDKAVAATKRETFQWRLNVLSSFTRKADKKTEL